MRRVFKLGISLGVWMVLVTIGGSAQSAPIPSPLLNARKVFLGNTGMDLNSQANSNFFSQDLSRKAYDAFYHQLQVWGHFQLVDNPADADLVLELGVRSEEGELRAQNSLRFDLSILDAKTHFTLWRFVEGFDYNSPRAATRDQNFSRHMEHLLGLVKELTSAGATT